MLSVRIRVLTDAELKHQTYNSTPLKSSNTIKARAVAIKWCRSVYATRTNLKMSLTSIWKRFISIRGTSGNTSAQRPDCSHFSLTFTAFHKKRCRGSLTILEGKYVVQLLPNYELSSILISSFRRRTEFGITSNSPFVLKP